MTFPKMGKRSRYGLFVDNVTTLIECERQCMRDFTCKGYDFSSITAQCYKDSNGEHFVYQPGTNYYKVETCPQGKLNASRLS